MSETEIKDSDSGETKSEEKFESGKERYHYKRNTDEDDDPRGKDMDGKGKKNPKYKRKVCKFCADKTLVPGLDYKRVDVLERFITNRGKILPRRITGSCAKHQRQLVREIKKARSICLLPYKVN